MPGTWNYGYAHSAGGVCLVVGDQLYFYFGAWSGLSPKLTGDMYAGGSTGLVVLRRDGFVSLDGDASGGEVAVEVLGEAEHSVPTRTDRTLQMVRWKDRRDLSALQGKPVRLRLHVTKAKLHAFWITPDESGASHGYVAAGGPGFTGHRDT